MNIPADRLRCPGFITDLVVRCARRDESALGELFDLFVTLVLSEVGDGVASLDCDALAVATFHRVWDESPRYDPRSQEVVAWVLDQARAVSGRPLRPLMGTATG
jgi:hypothetical protein